MASPKAATIAGARILKARQACADAQEQMERKEQQESRLHIVRTRARLGPGKSGQAIGEGRKPSVSALDS